MADRLLSIDIRHGGPVFIDTMSVRNLSMLKSRLP
jgi:hypothetical protein